mgnify:CR=1 FL=1
MKQNDNFTWKHWLGILAFIVLFLFALQPILLPFVLGFIVAYLLDPFVDFLEAKGLARGFATSIILFLFIMCVFFILLLIIPVLLKEAINFSSSIPELIANINMKTQELISWSENKLGKNPINEVINSLNVKNSLWILDLLKNIFSSSLAFFNTISLLIITPIVSWYFLRDWDNLLNKIVSLLPTKNSKYIQSLAKEIDVVLSAFIRGQFTVCVLLAFGYATSLSIIGLHNGLLIGVFSGIISFIPYVGSIIGLSLSLLIASSQFESYGPLFLVLLVFCVGQILEGNFLTPKLVGSRIGIHPVIIIFALFVGGYIFGFVGILIAVPISAIFAVLIRAWIKIYSSKKIL